MNTATIRVLDFEQRSEEWYDARRGLVTASSIGALITVGPPDPLTVTCPACAADPGDPCISVARKVPTAIKTVHDVRAAMASTMPPTYAPADNDTSRSLARLLVAERITGWTEETYTSSDMLRGIMDEPLARDLYSNTYAPVREVGFIIWEGCGVKIGFSPDGLVGDDGLIEVKSRRPKEHLATILADEVPAANMGQLQCGLLCSGRAWVDYLSYAGGLPMWHKRVYPDPQWFEAIIAAVQTFEVNAAEMVAIYNERTAGLPATERVNHFAEIEF